MAKANVRGGVTDSRTLKLAHSAATEAREVIVSNGQVLVAVNDALINADNIYVFGGRVEFPKAAPLAIAVGDLCYWDVADGNINKSSAGNTLAGICIEAAGSAATTVLVELDENK